MFDTGSLDILVMGCARSRVAPAGYAVTTEPDRFFASKPTPTTSAATLARLVPGVHSPRSRDVHARPNTDERCARLSASFASAMRRSPRFCQRTGDDDPRFLGETGWSDFSNGQFIGEGSFGIVYRARHARYGWFALKELRAPHSTAAQGCLDAFIHEALLWSGLTHPNVVGFHGVIIDPPTIVSELMVTSLQAHLQAMASRRFTASWVVHHRIACDIFRGTGYLHNRAASVLHRDLKPANILVDRQLTAKLADFGLARLHDCPGDRGTPCGTPNWTAPEILRAEPYGPAADIYSIGVILWGLATLRDPYKDKRNFRWIHLPLVVGDQGLRPIILRTDKIPGPWHQLLAACWAQKTEDRPTASAALTRLRSMTPSAWGGV